MATPFLRPKAKQSLKENIQTNLGAISPTVVAVFLSVAAHGVFIAFGPRPSFSFAALTEAAQLQDAEDSIVPIVQITPADSTNRLPAALQPRARTPLNSLPLPAGLPGLANTFPPRTIPNPARQLPSPSTQRQKPRSPSSTFNRPATGSATAPRPVFRPRPVEPVPLIIPESAPTPSTPTGPSGLPDLSDLSASNSGIPFEGPIQNQDLPDPPGTRSETATSEPASDNSLDELLARAQGTPSSANNPSATNDDNSESEVVLIPEEPIQQAPSQGNPRQLLNGYTYDPTYVDSEAAQDNLDKWLVASAENKSDLDSGTEKISIDSNFKACLDNPPAEGLIGVVVNPDGSQDAVEVLKSTGYDVLNRQALSAVERNDFGQVETPTQYQVTIEVAYEPSGCVEALPDAE